MIFRRLGVYVDEIVCWYWFTLLSVWTESNQRTIQGEGSCDSSLPFGNPTLQRPRRGEYYLCVAMVCGSRLCSVLRGVCGLLPTWSKRESKWRKLFVHPRTGCPDKSKFEKMVS